MARTSKLAKQLQAYPQKWLATISKPMTAAPAAAAAQVALNNARDVTRSVAFRWKGTTPPPPWPAHAELIEARRKMIIMRDGLRAIAKRVPDAKMKPKVRERLVEVGRELYRQLAELVERADKKPKAEDLIPAFALGGLGLLALVAFLFLKKKD